MKKKIVGVFITAAIAIQSHQALAAENKTQDYTQIGNFIVQVSPKNWHDENRKRDNSRQNLYTSWREQNAYHFIFTWTRRQS